MKVAFRADATPRIGSGHVVRCLCLADALRGHGAEAVFVGRRLPSALEAAVLRAGHASIALDDAQADDASVFIRAAAGAAWAVADHYALGPAWESAVRHAGMRLLAIDDLGRHHDTDLLLDQNFHPDAAARYDNRLPPDAVMLLGPRYALLRPAFAERRAAVHTRDGEVRRMLVFVGGMDADDVTSRVLDALSALERPDITVDVVVGAAHPALPGLRRRCAATAGWHLHVQTEDMAGLLAQTDLAVGAGGGATWERCALGVPTLALCLADNQRELLHAGARAGFVVAPEGLDGADPAALTTHLAAMLDNPGLRHHVSRTAFALVDGRGARRVAAEMVAHGIALRRAVRADSDDLLQWRNHDAVRQASRDPRPIDEAAHRQWLDTVLADPARHLLVGEQNGQPVGVVRLDEGDHGTAEVSIYLAPPRLGTGCGPALLRAAEQWLRAERPAVRELRADVMAGNRASTRLFEAAGYACASTHYVKRI